VPILRDTHFFQICYGFDTLLLHYLFTTDRQTAITARLNTFHTCYMKPAISVPYIPFGVHHVGTRFT
jgi:hypothetical protein